MHVLRLLICIVFFFTDAAATEIYTLSLHDALPISLSPPPRPRPEPGPTSCRRYRPPRPPRSTAQPALRSEEHTSELQSHSDLVCRLLLEKKKKNTKTECIHSQRYHKTQTLSRQRNP